MMTTGRPREQRGHRHLGGVLGSSKPCGLGETRERHYVAAAVAVVAALASAYATYSASQAQAASNRYNAKVAENQAINAQNEAKVEMERRRELYRRQMAAQNAAIGASGVVSYEGTPLLLEVDSAEQAALDLARVRYQGETRSTAYQSEVNLQRFAAKSNVRQGYIGAGASLLQGASSATGASYRSASGASTAAANNTMPY